MPETRCNLHRWIVALSSSWVMAIVFGFLFSFGVLYVNIMEEFQISRAEAAVVQSTLYGVVIGTGVLGGLLITQVGCRTASMIGGTVASAGLIMSHFASSIQYLIVSLAIVSGLGMSILLITTVLIVGEHFDGKHRSAVIAVVVSSSAFGGMVYPHMLNKMSDTFSLQGKLLIVGGLFLNTVPATYLWTPARRKKTTNQNNTTTEAKGRTICSTVRSLVKMKQYIFFALGAACVVPTYNAFLALNIDIFFDILGDESQCVMILFIFNAVSLVGRLLPGCLKGLCKVKTISFPILFALLGLVGMLALPFVSGFASCVVVVCILSVSFGGIITILSVVTMRIVGMDLFPVAVGVMYTLEGILNLITAPLTGLTRDLTGTYTIVLFAFAGGIAVGCVFFILAAILQRIQGQREPDKDVIEVEVLESLTTEVEL